MRGDEDGFGEELSRDENNDNESENDNVSNEIIKEDETTNWFSQGNLFTDSGDVTLNDEGNVVSEVEFGLDKVEGSFERFNSEYEARKKEIKEAAQLLKDNYNLKIAKEAIKTDEELKAKNPKWLQRFVTSEKIKNERYDEFNAKDWETINNTDALVFIDNLGAITPSLRKNALEIHKQASEIFSNVNKLGVKKGTPSYNEAINLASDFQHKTIAIKLLKDEVKKNPGTKLQLDVEIKKVENEVKEIEERWTELNKETTESTIKEIENTRKVFIESGIKNSKTLTSEEFKAKQKELGYEIDPNASALVNRKTGEVFIDIELAGKQRARGVELHGQILNATMGSLRNAKGKISSEGKVILKDFMEGLSPSVRKLVRERVERDYKFDKNRKELAFEEYGEQYATAYEDLIRSGTLKIIEPTREVNVAKITTGAELINAI